MTTDAGIDEFFEYAANNGVRYSSDDAPGHLTPNIIGNDAYEYIMRRVETNENAIGLEVDKLEKPLLPIDKTYKPTIDISEWIFKLIDYIKSKIEKD